VDGLVTANSNIYEEDNQPVERSCPSFLSFAFLAK